MSDGKLEAVTTIVQSWADKQGHDRCWYYPELFEKLAAILGVTPKVSPNLPPRHEFERGCREYQDKEFGNRQTNPKQWLNREELIYVLTSDKRVPYDLVVAAEFTSDFASLRLWTDKLEEVCVPANYFEPSANCSPDFRRLEIIDHGLTIKLGEYECDAQKAIEHARR